MDWCREESWNSAKGVFQTFLFFLVCLLSCSVFSYHIGVFRRFQAFLGVGWYNLSSLRGKWLKWLYISLKPYVRHCVLLCVSLSAFAPIITFNKKLTLAQAIDNTHTHILIQMAQAKEAVKYVKDALVCTDEWWGYNSIKKLFKHSIVNHKCKEYVRDDIYTNTVEFLGLWEYLQTQILKVSNSTPF